MPAGALRQNTSGNKGRCDPVTWDCHCDGVRTCGTGWLP